MEYRYAVDTGKPIIGFLHADPSQLPSKDCETNDAARAKLAGFRDYVGSKLCKMWTSPSDLGAKVSRSLTQLIKNQPAVGWVPANAIPSDELLALRRKVDDLQAKLNQVALQGPAGIDDLARGDDLFSMGFSFDRELPKVGKSNQTYWVKGGQGDWTLEWSWDDFFASIAPSLIEPCEAHQIVNVLNGTLLATSRPDMQKALPGERFLSPRVFRTDYQIGMVQLRALGLIATAGEIDTWVLTPYGNQHMNKLLAVKRRSRKRRK